MVMGMLLSRSAAALALALSLGACFGGARAPAELLTLTAAQTPQPGATRSGDGEPVTVMTPSVPRSMSTTRIPVYVSATSIQYLQNATYVEQPNELFRQLLSETIAARTGRLVLNPDVYSQVPGLTLNGQLLQFGLDPTRSEAVVTFEAAAARSASAVRTQRFEARVPVTQAVAAQVAPALNQAANQVAEQVAAWIGG
jgi:cholesterol transport system auxiliary component